MSKEQLLALFGETEETLLSRRTKKVVILKLQTSIKLHGKFVWMFVCMGHKKATTNPNFLFEGKGWADIANICAVFRVVEKKDDGRAAFVVKKMIKEGKLK